jgi:hypothetical protein
MSALRIDIDRQELRLMARLAAGHEAADLIDTLAEVLFRVPDPDAQALSRELGDLSGWLDYEMKNRLLDEEEP